MELEKDKLLKSITVEQASDFYEREGIAFVCNDGKVIKVVSDKEVDTRECN